MQVPKPFIGASIAAAMALAFPLIAQWEGKRNDPYKDIVGVMTVCYGETRVQMRRYTDTECNAMLQKAIEGFAGEVLKVNPQLINRPIQLAAATSLSYNIGSSAYAKSTVAKKFNQGDYRGACEAFKMWRIAGGKVSQGLVNRRNAEYALCITYI